jgi:hypothetical protein
MFNSSCLNICIHVRRGDYLNVASYVIPASHFIQISDILHNIPRAKLFVVSDTELEGQLKTFFESKRALVLEGGDIYLIHALMRMSDILVCSNSQFSFSAALLNRNQLSLIPRSFITKSFVEDIALPISEWVVMQK